MNNHVNYVKVLGWVKTRSVRSAATAASALLFHCLSSYCAPVVLILPVFLGGLHKLHGMAECLSFRYHSLTADLWGIIAFTSLGPRFRWPLKEVRCQNRKSW